MSLKRFFSLALLAALLGIGRFAEAQELFARVVINASQSGVMDKSVFDEATRQMQDFLNLRRRTGDQFQQEERIICTINIQITGSPASNIYDATATIQAVRPVYGTSLETVMLNYVDPNFTFEYSPGQPMEFNEQSPGYTDNLTSLLSFYAYMILGLDYDSFSKLGGKSYFLRAQQIALAASSGPYKGWKAFEGTNNRNWLVENYMNQQLLPFREGLYNYHRLALDKFDTDPDGARVQVMGMLQTMKDILQVKPICIAINTFLDSKSTEIVQIFQKAQPQDKRLAYNILVQIDPTKTDRYQQLLQ